MSRRKLGTSRRNKGKQLTKDPETEAYLETRGDFEEETRGNKTLETEVSAAAQLEIQDKKTRGSEHGTSKLHDSTGFSDSLLDHPVVKNTTISPEDVMENLMPKIDNLQTCKTDSKLKEMDESNFVEDEEVKENAPTDGPSEAPNSSISAFASVNKQLMNKQEADSSRHAAAKSESSKKDDTDLFRQDGSLQRNHMVSESQICSVDFESIKPEITADKSSPRENTEVKHDVGQVVLLSPNEELSINVEHEDFAQLSVDAVNKMHGEDDKPTQMQGLDSTPDVNQDICLKEGSLKAVDQTNEVDHAYDLKHTRTNTGTGKTGVGQINEGGVHVKDDDVNLLTVDQENLCQAESIHSSLQTLPSETFAHIDSQHQDRSLRMDEQTDSGFGHVGNRRKFGSRRRNKGQQRLTESEEEDLEHNEVDQALEKEILETSVTSQEELNKDPGLDVILSVPHDTSMLSLTAPGHLPEVHSSSPENFILNSQNLPEDHNERETEMNVNLYYNSLEVIPEEADKSDSEDTSSVHRSEEVQEDEVLPTQMQEIVQMINSSEAVTDNASENNEISGNLVIQSDITNQYDVTEKSSDESALPDSQYQDSSVDMDEQTNTGFREDALKKVQEDELNPESDYSPETLPDDAPICLEISTGVLTDQAEIINAYQSEFTVESTDDSTAQDAASNLADKPDEYFTEQDKPEAFDLRNEDYGTNKSQISDEENFAPNQEQELKGRVEGDKEPNSDHIFHQEKEGPPYETDGMKFVDYQSQDRSNVDEVSHADFHHSGNRRKLGSSRRNKGKHKIEDSVMEAYHETREEAEVNSSNNESGEAVLLVETAGLEKYVELFQEQEGKNGAPQTDGVKFDTQVCTSSELPPTDAHSTSTEAPSLFEKPFYRPDEDFFSMYSTADTVSRERRDSTELPRLDGNLQNYLVCIPQEIHSEKSNSGEHVKDECKIEKEPAEDELPTKQEQLNEVRQAQLSDDAVKVEHGQVGEPTEMSQIDYTPDKNRDDAAVDAEISDDVYEQTEIEDIKQSEFAMKSDNYSKPQINDKDRLQDESGDVYEAEGQVIMMNPVDDEMGHQVTEGLSSETGDTESSLQSLQHETHAVLDSQFTSLNPSGNSGAVGSSQEKSKEIKLEGMDKSDTSHADNMAVHGKQNAHLGTAAGICEFTTSSPSAMQQLIKSNSTKLPDDRLPSVSSATETKESDGDTEKLGPYGNLQGSHLTSENVEFSIPPERTAEKSRQEDQTEVEYSFEQETSLSRENFPTNGNQDEHFNSSKAKGALPPEVDVTRKHNEQINQAQMPEMHQINDTMIIEEKSPLQTVQSDTHLTLLDSQPKDSCQSFKDESHSGAKLAGNRRKLGSSRRDKTRQQGKVIKGNQESKEGVVESTEMLVATTTKQEESEDLICSEKINITSMSGDENTEKLQCVLDNNAVATSDINPGSDNGDSVKFNKDLDERHTELVKEPDNLSQFTGYDTVNLMQSPVCVEKDDSDVQSILYHDDTISHGSGIVPVLDQEAAFQCQITEVKSCDKDSEGQEVHLQQTDNVMETMRCVTTKDCNRKTESSMDAPGLEQDKAREKHAVQEIDTSQESAVDMSRGSGNSSPMDVRKSLQEKTQSDYNENLQVKSKEKKRKMGSTRRTRLNRKQEEDTDSKESDFNTEAVIGDPDKLEVVEELPLTAEVLQSEHATSLPGTVDTVALKVAAFERDVERNVDEIPQQDDFTNAEAQFTSVATETNSSTLSQILPSNTETNTGISIQTQEESVELAHVQDDDEQKLSNLLEGTQCKNLESKNPSPNLDSPNRKRKLGSTRKNLSSRTRREDLNPKQELENKPTEAATTGENVMPESSSTLIEKDLQVYYEHRDSDSDQRKDKVFETVEFSHVGESLSMPVAEQTAKESSVSQSQVTEPENHPESELTLAPSPKNDALSELVSGGRRRKFGSNRKSNLHQSNKDQTAREAQVIGAQNNEEEEDAQVKGAEERREESPGLDKRSKVDESNKKVLSFGISQPASQKTPIESEIRFGQESQGELSFADASRTDLKSNSYNVVMVGDSCVGKTSFMKRAQSGKFSLDIPASVGLDSCMWTVLVEGKPVVLQLWDTAGQERFRSITRQIFHKAQAFLLMYDISSSQSFSAVSFWANSIQEAATENVTVLLLGNKSDHAQRQVKTEQGEILAKEYNYEFLECSAATGENVIQALEIVARMLSQRSDFREEATVLHKEPGQKKRSTCC